MCRSAYSRKIGVLSGNCYAVRGIEVRDEPYRVNLVVPPWDWGGGAARNETGQDACLP